MAYHIGNYEKWLIGYVFYYIEKKPSSYKNMKCRARGYYWQRKSSFVLAILYLRGNITSSFLVTLWHWLCWGQLNETTFMWLAFVELANSASLSKLYCDPSTDRLVTGEYPAPHCMVLPPPPPPPLPSPKLPPTPNVPPFCGDPPTHVFPPPPCWKFAPAP